MSFDIIKLKQDMLRISNDIDFDKIQKELNTDFASFLQASTWTAPQVELLTNIQNQLLNQFKHNTELINATVNQPTAVTQRDNPFKFTALLPLQNFQSEINHYPKKIKDKINKLTKKILTLQKNYVKFAQANENLSDASSTLISEHSPALAKTIKALKSLPENSMSSNAKQIMEKHLPNYDDDASRRELKKLADSFEKDNRRIEVKLLPFVEFLAKRWEKIRNTPQSYTRAPNDDFNKTCLELATAIANVSPDLGRFSVLMPTVTVVQSDVTDNYFDDPDLKLEQIILNDDQTRFIEIGASLSLAENDTILKNTTLVNEKMEILSNSEQSALINHSELTQKYYKAITDLRNFTIGKYDNALIKPPGVYLQKLAEQLEQGGAYHINPAAGLLAGDSRIATPTNAGEAANVGILEFSGYLDSLPDIEKEKLFALRVDGATENFGQIWRRLSTPNAADLTDTRNCVELMAPQIRTILAQNYDLYNVLDFSVDQFHQSLAQAKQAFEAGIHSNQYQQNQSQLSEAEQRAVNIAFTDALLANEDELALQLAGLGANPNDRVLIQAEKTPLLILVVQRNKTAVLEKMLQMPVSLQVLRESLFAAIQANNTEAALKILDHSISVANSVGGVDLKHFAVLAMEQGNAAILKKLLQKGANRAHTDNQGVSLFEHLMKITDKDEMRGSRVQLLSAFIDNPVVLNNTEIGNIFSRLMHNLRFSWSSSAVEGFILKYKEQLADPVNAAMLTRVIDNMWDHEEEFLRAVAIEHKLTWLMKPLLLNKYYSGSDKRLNDFLPLFKGWSDAAAAELLKFINPYLAPDLPNIVGNKHYYFEINLTRPYFEPLIARTLFDMGADPNVGTVFKRLVRKGEHDFALHIIASGRLTAKTLLSALQLPKLNPAVEKQLVEALAVVHESTIKQAVKELQLVVDSTQSLTLGLFKHVNTTMLARAVTKLIAQLEKKEILEFSTQEIAALKNAKVAKILNKHKSDNDIPAVYLKAHSRKELDNTIRAHRGAGDTARDKLITTISAIELDLDRQQERLAARLLKNPNKETRANINVKLDAIMQAQDKINGFKNREGTDVAGFIREISAARDHARSAKSVTHMESAKKLFGKNLGDSDTADILNRAVNDLNKLDREMVKENKRKLG